MPQPDLVK